ncbi:anion exchange protein 3 [Echinococcus multilocularis]|uniref:Anion exchange protein 3 n=1 Tax=Echinococcus multilocularis TaxID=6211 RepID=A0A068YI23_ECHMU|nr:anion exchange protein 3 [Echinococcus multilocularis]
MHLANGEKGLRKMTDKTYGEKPHSDSRHGSKPLQMFTEISLLMDGEIPKGAIPVTSTRPPSNQHWGELARYILYEEVFDEESRKFASPQYPSISFRYFDRFCSILHKDLRVLQSNATTSEQLMKEIAKFVRSEDDLTGPEDLEKLELALSAPRWHPQVNRPQDLHLHPRLSLTGPGRRLSLVSRNENAMEWTNKNLSECLPKTAEACSAMIGHLPYLTRHLYLLIRLTSDPAPKLRGVVEVDIGIRFVFLALTPKIDEEGAMYQIGRCFATMLNESKFLSVIRQSQKLADIYKAALVFRREIIAISGGYSEVLNRHGGIDVPPSYDNEVEFERADLVFEDVLDAALNNEMTSSNLSLQKESQVHCSSRSFKRLCPPFRELVEGFKALAFRMPSDYIDAFTKNKVITMLSSIPFIYFVVFAPSVTFGTLMFNEVNESYNISLNIFSAGVFTILYSLFAGQPLGSIGISGPSFFLETVIGLFAAQAGVDYWAYRFLTGLYMTAFGIILISMNLSSMVLYARRSLEEIFSAFISLFLILKSTFSMFRAVPLEIYQPNNSTSVDELQKALNSSQTGSRAAIQLFLALCMLVFSLLINKLKRSHLFRRTFRYWIGAFNVPLGIVFVTALNYIFFSTYPTTKLGVPPAVEADPNTWFVLVDFSKMDTLNRSPALVHGTAVVIGFFFCLLIFTEIALNSVTALKPKAKKPSPFVMDHVLTVVIFPLMSCILGWPFVSGVPVRTIANTMALIIVDPHPPPGKPAEIISLVEQRVSVLIVGVLVTLSVYLGDILHLVPVAALYGMFLYLGLIGLRGLDSVNTLTALLTRRKHWGRWEFLTDLPKPQLAVIVSINFGELAILVVFIILAEFTDINYVTLATPLVLIGSGLVREFLLPKWQWLAPTLAKYDKRCLPAHPKKTETENKSEASLPDKNDRLSSVETLIF